MKIIREHSVKEFLDKNEELLLSNESEHNLLLGLAGGLLNNQRPLGEALFYSIEKNETPIAAAMRTDLDKPFILSQMKSELIKPLSEFLKAEEVQLKGVIGPIDLATEFKEHWGSDAEVGMHQGIYQLDSVVHPSYDGGKLVLVTEADYEVAFDLCMGFVKDCFPKEENAEKIASEAAKRHIENECLFFWKDSQSKVVSMTANSRETKNGATLSWVYTPKELRGKGHASRVVASLSPKLLEKKRFCNLFTDLLNPTSNSIYKKIGYKMIAESIHFNFTS